MHVQEGGLTESWIKLLRNLPKFYYYDQRRFEMAGHVPRMREVRNTF